MDVISHFAARYERTREEEYSLEEYLELCKRDKLGGFKSEVQHPGFQ